MEVTRIATEEYLDSLNENLKNSEFIYKSKYGGEIKGTVKHIGVGWSMHTEGGIHKARMDGNLWTHYKPVFRVHSNESGYGYELERCFFKDK